MKNILTQIETPYVDAQTLLTFLSDYQKPREWILRKVKSGELIRLKNGFYLIQNKIEDGGVPYEQVANLLYGPSYVSLEWALSFYGMIPERVHTVTSMALGRAKEYQTPVGSFSYVSCKSATYSVGVDLKKAQNSTGNFFMATPEKALVDFVYVNCKNLKGSDLEVDLFESKRMDRETLAQLNKPLLLDIAKAYCSKNIDQLLRLL